LKSDSPLHDAVGSQIYQLHYAAGRQNLAAAFCIMQRGVKPLMQRVVKSYRRMMQRGVNLQQESSLKFLEDAQGP
jgi:hypothetical protein